MDWPSFFWGVGATVILLIAVGPWLLAKIGGIVESNYRHAKPSSRRR